MRTDEIKNEIDETRKWEKNWTKRLKMQIKYLHDFQQFEKIRSFGDNIYTGKAEMDHANLLEKMVKFDYKSKPKAKESKHKKRNTFYSAIALY